jgi:hypothetical protein
MNGNGIDKVVMNVAITQGDSGIVIKKALFNDEEEDP